MQQHRARVHRPAATLTDPRANDLNRPGQIRHAHPTLGALSDVRRGQIRHGRLSAASHIRQVAHLPQLAHRQPLNLTRRATRQQPRDRRFRDTQQFRDLAARDTPIRQLIHPRDRVPIKLPWATHRPHQRPRPALSDLPPQTSHMLSTDPEHACHLNALHPSPRQRHDREVTHPPITPLIARQRPTATGHHHVLADRLQPQLQRRRHPRQLARIPACLCRPAQHPTTIPNQTYFCKL